MVKATFTRATDGQIGIRLSPSNDEEKILIEEWCAKAGSKASVTSERGGRLLLTPKDVAAQ